MEVTFICDDDKFLGVLLLRDFEAERGVEEGTFKKSYKSNYTVYSTRDLHGAVDFMRYYGFEFVYEGNTYISKEVIIYEDGVKVGVKKPKEDGMFYTGVMPEYADLFN